MSPKIYFEKVCIAFKKCRMNLSKKKKGRLKKVAPKYGSLMMIIIFGWINCQYIKFPS